MGKKMCELCQQELANDMRFGVRLCSDCVNRFSEALTGDGETAVRFLRTEKYANATNAARTQLLSVIASRAERLGYKKNVQVQQSAAQQTSSPADTSSPATGAPQTEHSGVLDDLYTDIGGKIKGWAKWIFIIETIASVVGALIIMGTAEDGIGAILGLLFVVVGPLLAWVSSWILYAFGELVEKTCANERNTRNILRILQEKGKLS